jgi:hypothetical protein
VGAEIPHDIRRLLADSIESLRQLDALLCMRESGHDTSWTVSELNAQLRSSETALEQDLVGLLAAGLVETVAGPPTAWRYAPGAKARTVDALAACYRTHRTSVIGLVVSGAESSIDQFADAFRLRRKEDLDG